jgi:hypothetical protein
MRFAFRLLPALVLTLGLLAAPAAATHAPDQNKRMTTVFTSPNQAINSDFAFWGNYAFSGYYTGDAGVPAGTPPRGGVRIFDISDPSHPKLVRDFACDGLQADPIVWDRNGNGVPDLLLLGVDRTMEAPECGAPRSFNPDGSANHGDPDGWEGVRVLTMSDDPANPFTDIQQLKAVYTDCGAHTITAWPGEIEETGRLLVYASSYPLRAGPTCGDTEFQNTANPFDEDPGLPANPRHGVIQVVEVPLDDPAASQELDVQPAISYPGDPDGQLDWSERDPGIAPPAFEPAAVACHDIVVRVNDRIAGGACGEQGQVWEIDENGIPQTQSPTSIVDDKVTSGGTGQVPGAVDFFHSVMFDNEGEAVNWVDESFGLGCPTMTEYDPRPWNPSGGTHKTGRAMFTDLAGSFLSDFQVGDVRPDPGETEYCSAHMGLSVAGINRDLLVNAWYTGGVNVLDFTHPESLREVAYYDPKRDTATWSAYAYTGPLFKSGTGIPVYASDGVEHPSAARGMVVYRTQIRKPTTLLDHLNPQTMDWE